VELGKLVVLTLRVWLAGAQYLEKLSYKTVTSVYVCMCVCVCLAGDAQVSW